MLGLPCNGKAFSRQCLLFPAVRTRDSIRELPETSSLRTDFRGPGSLGCARDFACGLRRPQTVSTSTPRLSPFPVTRLRGAPLRMTGLFCVRDDKTYGKKMFVAILGVCGKARFNSRRGARVQLRFSANRIPSALCKSLSSFALSGSRANIASRAVIILTAAVRSR